MNHRIIARNFLEKIGNNNPEFIAEHFGYDIEIINEKDKYKYIDMFGSNIELVDGFTVPEKNKIYAIENGYRTKFTIYHELGHIILEHPVGYHSKLRNSVNYHKYESEADEVASELLFPYKKFVDDTNNLDFNYNNIERISDKYEASFIATAFRYVDCSDKRIIFMEVYKQGDKWIVKNSRSAKSLYDEKIRFRANNILQNTYEAMVFKNYVSNNQGNNRTCFIELSTNVLLDNAMLFDKKKLPSIATV